MKLRMRIRKWEGGWRWSGKIFGATPGHNSPEYDLGWVETMSPKEALRELRYWMPSPYWHGQPPFVFLDLHPFEWPESGRVAMTEDWP